MGTLNKYQTIERAYKIEPGTRAFRILGRLNSTCGYRESAGLVVVKSALYEKLKNFVESLTIEADLESEKVNDQSLSRSLDLIEESELS